MKVLFLDRDGVINKTTASGFVLKWEEFEFLPDVIDAIKLVNKCKIPIYVISNQSCVGRGLLTLDELKKINRNMLRELEKQGAHIDDMFFCPHSPDEGCDCRKPNTGLFKQAAKKHKGIDFASSWFIGDSETDIEAGKKIGSHTYLIKDRESLLPVVKNILSEG